VHCIGFLKPGGQSLATRINRMCHQDAQQRGREKSQDHGVSGDSR
jgi:hypothetical protein